jgi:hypothetical protein
MMAKVDRKVKREANSEFPPWDYVPYKDQSENYFMNVRKLSGEGFNPKANFPPNIMYGANIAKVFGLSFKGFKTTNLNLHLETRRIYLGFIAKCMVQTK